MAELPSHPHSGGYFNLDEAIQAARKPLEAKQRSISVSERQCLTRLKDLQAIIGIYDRETVSGVMGPTNQEYAECLKFVEDKADVPHLPIWTWDYDYYRRGVTELKRRYELCASRGRPSNSLPDGWIDLLDWPDLESWNLSEFQTRVTVRRYLMKLIRDVPDLEKREAYLENFAELGCSLDIQLKEHKQSHPAGRHLPHGAVQHLVAVAKTALARAHAHQLLAAKMESIVGALELLEREDNVELTYDEYFGCFIELLVWAYSSSVPSTLSGSMLIHCIAARSLGWDQLVTGRTQFRALHGSGRAVEPLLHQVTEREWTSPHASTALRRGILKGMKSPGPYDGLVQLLAQLRLATRHDVSMLTLSA